MLYKNLPLLYYTSSTLTVGGVLIVDRLLVTFADDSGLRSLLYGSQDPGPAIQGLMTYSPMLHSLQHLLTLTRDVGGGRVAWEGGWRGRAGGVGGRVTWEGG